MQGKPSDQIRKWSGQKIYYFSFLEDVRILQEEFKIKQRTSKLKKCFTYAVVYLI